MLINAAVVLMLVVGAYSQQTEKAPTFSVSLDDPPETRWSHIVAHYKVRDRAFDSRVELTVAFPRDTV